MNRIAHQFGTYKLCLLIRKGPLKSIGMVYGAVCMRTEWMSFSPENFFHLTEALWLSQTIISERLWMGNALGESETGALTRHAA